jgi:hypothetical protein
MGVGLGGYLTTTSPRCKDRYVQDHLQFNWPRYGYARSCSHANRRQGAVHLL